VNINDFIKRRPYLIWHTENFDNLSVDSIVEAVLNYGNWSDFKKMIKILGMKKTASIFRKRLKQKRCNYRPEIKNYFQLYFQKYA